MVPTLPSRAARHTRPARAPLATALACAAALGAFIPWGTGAPAAAQDAEPGLEQVAAITSPHTAEISGIVRSRTHEDTWWVHNDSGDEARLFAVDKDGTVIVPPWLQGRFHGVAAMEDRDPWPGIRIPGGSNIDWEDIALADGLLYVAEMGNNGNARRDLGIWVIEEPNPRAIERTRPLKFLPVAYPDQRAFPAAQWHFDCESLFVFRDRLYVLTKHRVAGEINRGQAGTKLYRLDTDETDEDNVLTLVERRDDLPMPTAADLSPDGTRLAVLTYQRLYVFETDGESDRFLSGRERRLDLPFLRTGQAEAVCWDDDETLRIVPERRPNQGGNPVFTVPLEALEPAD